MYLLKYFKVELLNHLASISWRKERLLLFIFIYFIYNLNLRLINSGDTWPAAMLPFAILEDRALCLDMFAGYFESLSFNPYMVVLQDGHYFSFYPIVIPVLLTPLYLIPYLLLNSLHYQMNMLNTSFYLVVFILEKIFASLIATSSVVLCFMAWRQLMRKEIAYLCTAIFALATNTWSTSAQALWQQGMAELLMSMLIYLVVVNEKNRLNRRIVCMGVLSGLFIFNRPSDSLLLLPLFIYVMSLSAKEIVCYAGPMLGSGLPFLIYNAHHFKNAFGGYGGLLSEFTLSPTTFVNMSGLLFSPSRGLLVYSPILILSVFGYGKIADVESQRLRRFFYVAGFSILLQIGVYGCFRVWWGGYSYGPRFLVSILPLLVTYIGFYLNDIPILGRVQRRDLLCLSLIALLFAWSTFVQAVGAFCYPNGNWDGTPQSVNQYPERLWDWNDTQIGRSFHSGPIIVNPFYIFDYIVINKSARWEDDREGIIKRLRGEGIIGRLSGYDNASGANPKAAQVAG